MNSNVKTKVLRHALVLVLLALQSNAILQNLVFSDCDSDSWHLFNVQVEEQPNGLSVVADVAFGSNSSVVHEVNITTPHCFNLAGCKNTPITKVERNVLCNSTNLTPILNSTCAFITAVAHSEAMITKLREGMNVTKDEACIKYEETTLNSGWNLGDEMSDEDTGVVLI